MASRLLIYIVKFFLLILLGDIERARFYFVYIHISVIFEAAGRLIHNCGTIQKYLHINPAVSYL